LWFRRSQIDRNVCNAIRIFVDHNPGFGKDEFHDVRMGKLIRSKVMSKGLSCGIVLKTGWGHDNEPPVNTFVSPRLREIGLGEFFVA
jgi:hypothetical protein